MRRDDEADGAVNAGQLLEDDRILEVAEPGPAVLLREDNSQQPHVRQLGNDLRGEASRLVPFHDVGKDLRFGELADGAANLLLLFGQAEVHSTSGEPSPTSSTRSGGR